ncbi:flagellar hook-associated protein FlgK [Clostridium sp.]|uniref:flagellar hook-associated protein FlgK n=1 Tax=Clostridium sp. TaxID=1506 RepID=UPI00283F5C96|nr:flagellar hook-associated protein FlgK [Clostridium sp.]MDR3593975.1 flagellar hook-associated protein FlgK [Clostridium sp.]
MAGLFDTFTIATRGLNVQQSAINTTSHNIANANTDGYSRQRAVSETTTPSGGNSKFDSGSVGQVGTGAEITSIQRIRDSFLDTQVRSETGISAYYSTTSDTLTQVESVFGEPSDTGIEELTSNFFNAFQEVNKTPNASDVKSVAIQDASTLADAINSAYNQLQKMCQDTQSVLQANVTDVNSYLDQINDLNKQIGKVSAVGETANDLMDKRDNLLDELSNKFGIKIDNSSSDTINVSSTEYPNSTLVKSNAADTNYSRLSYVKNATFDKTSGNITVEYYPLGNTNATPKSFTVTGGDQALTDKINQCGILIGDKDGIVGTSTTDPTTNVTTTTPPTTAAQLNAEVFQTYQYESGVNSVDNNNIKGDIAANQAVQSTIQGYMDNLDRLAAGLAYSVNAIQTGSIDSSTASQGLQNNPIFINSGNTTTTTDTGITAATIKVNSALVSDPTLLNCNTTSTSGQGDGARANAIANLNVLKMNLSNVASTDDLTTMTRKQFLENVGINDTSGNGTGFSDTTCLNLNAGTSGSTLDSYYKTTINNLAVASQEASRQSTNQNTVLSNLQDQKSSVSGVSLDEETTNLIQFQHAYQANAKVISTIDNLLDVVINGLMKS